MTPWQWLSLFIIYVGYLVLGGFVFRSLETVCDHDYLNNFYYDQAQGLIKEDKNEFRKHENLLHALHRLRTTAFLKACLIDALETLNESQSDHLDRVLWSMRSVFAVTTTSKSNSTMEMYKRGVNEQRENCEPWELYDAIFFSFTVVTTIGYGHLSPSTPTGKVACIVYALLGIPMNGVLIGSLGIFFSHVVKRAVGSSPFKQDDGSEDGRHRGQRLLRLGILVFKVVIALIPGGLIFLVAPALFFVYMEEEWDFLDSFYFSFITLTTIGFGDFVAGRHPSMEDRLGNMKQFYDLFVITWILFGLGYLAMIVGLIVEGLRTQASEAVRQFRQADKALNYFLRILQEIRYNREDGSVVGGRAASEPTLLEEEASDIHGDERGNTIRRVRSMSNIHDDTLTDDDNVFSHRPPPSRTHNEDRVDSCDDANSLSSVLTESFDIDYDTIKSLKEFLSTAKALSGHQSDGMSFANESFASDESSVVRRKFALNATNRKVESRQRSKSSVHFDSDGLGSSVGSERLSIEVSQSRPQRQSVSTVPSVSSIVISKGILEVASTNVKDPNKDEKDKRETYVPSPSVLLTPTSYDSSSTSSKKKRSASVVIGSPRKLLKVSGRTSTTTLSPYSPTAPSRSPTSVTKQRRATSVMIGVNQGRHFDVRRPRSSVSNPVSPFSPRSSNSSSFDEFLRSTTLEEFLNAARIVDLKSDQDSSPQQRRLLP